MSELSAASDAGSRGAPAFAPVARPGAFLLALLAWIAGVVIVTSIATPPLFAALEGVRPGLVTFPRLARRLAIPVALLLLWWIARRLEIRHWRQLGATGEGWRSGAAWRAAVAGFGAATTLFLAELLIGDRVVQVDLSWWRPAVIVVAAVLIGLREELVFRGAFLFPFGRLGGAAGLLQGLLLPGLYAAAHFARGNAQPLRVEWSSGFELWAGLVRSAVAHPPAYTGLFALGLFLHLLARRQGHVWGAVGFHAGAVAAIQLCGGLTEGVDRHRTLFFADGLLPGWGAALVLGVACLLLLRRPSS